MLEYEYMYWEMLTSIKYHSLNTLSITSKNMCKPSVDCCVFGMNNEDGHVGVEHLF